MPKRKKLKVQVRYIILDGGPGKLQCLRTFEEADQRKGVFSEDFTATVVWSDGRIYRGSFRAYNDNLASLIRKDCEALHSTQTRMKAWCNKLLREYDLGGDE